MTKTESDNRKTLLRRSIFRDLPKVELDEFVRTLQSRVVGPGEFIFKEGDPADAFYIIGSGRVRIFVRRENRIEREISVSGPGEYFGEVALLAGETRRSANVESLAETHLMVLSKERFDRLLRDYPDLSRNFVRKMRGWLLKGREIIEEADAVIGASRVSWFDFLLVIGVSVLLAITFNISNPYGIPLVPVPPDPVPSVSASAAMKDYRQGQTLIVDAMPGNFYQLRHIRGAVNMPMALFDIVYLMSFSEADKDKKIVVYGNTVSRSYDLEIAGKLLLRGYRDVKVLDGGLRAWEANGYPVEQKDSK
ncbi:MAG: cyclic nucleotide-binding domain-containing protein [Syntrophobacteraceae bacterium]|jgi:rhodanese-related sulfurtransferase